MSSDQVLDGLTGLRLSGMRDELQHQLTHPAFNEQPFTDRILGMVNAEYERRHHNKMDRRIKAAQFKYHAAPEDIKFSAARGVKKEILLELLKCDWIERRNHILITGASGTGKTWISCALGMAAARKEMTVRYGRVSRILEEVQYARLDGSLHKLRRKFASFKLLILDDFALHPLNKQERVDLFELIEDRSSVTSLIIVGQRPVQDWYGYIKDPLIADAFMDRVQSGSHILQLEGPSYR